MPDYDSTTGIVTIDFKAHFPHKYWVSSWSKDDQYPQGFRYKLLSVRPEPDGLIELVVVLEDASGAKSEMSRWDVSPSALDRTAATFTDGLGEAYMIDFVELDLTTVRDQREFERRVGEAGWHSMVIE